MAKKPGRPGQAADNGAGAPQHGAKSQAIRDYLTGHKKAMPKEVVLALKQKGIDVSPNMVSIIKTKSRIKKAHRKAKQAIADGSITAAQSGNVAALDASLILYKAALGLKTPPAKVRQSFLTVVESLG